VPGAPNSNATIAKPTWNNNRAPEPKKIIAVVGNNHPGQQQRSRMNGQLTGMSSNPIHVLSAGAGDLKIVNYNGGAKSPTYQETNFHQTKTNASGDPRQKNSQSTGRATRQVNSTAQSSGVTINFTNRPYQTITAGGIADHAALADKTLMIGHTHTDFATQQKNLNQTIDGHQF